MTTQPAEKCTICNGRGYLRCDCWPGDCICGWGDEPCEYCDGTGFLDPDDDGHYGDDDCANIAYQIRTALDAATHENGYPHEYDRDPADIVREIHDWSGIEAFDPDNPADMQAGVNGVLQWRLINPQPISRRAAK